MYPYRCFAINKASVSERPKSHVYRVKITNDLPFEIPILLNLYQKGQTETDREYIPGPVINIEPNTTSELIVESAAMRGLSLSRLFAKILKIDKMLEVRDKETYKVSEILRSKVDMNVGYDWLYKKPYDPYDDL